MWLDLIWTLKCIQSKWTFHILFVLWEKEKAHFNGLKKATKPITSRVLSSHLKQLIQLGLVIKNVIIEKPLRVEYQLSEKGKNFLSSIINLFTDTTFTKHLKKRDVPY